MSNLSFLTAGTKEVVKEAGLELPVKQIVQEIVTSKKKRSRKRK